MFVYHGYDVTVATDGEKALQLWRQRRFDLILLDVMLPKVDGFSVCDEIRKTDREQPIIMLTAKSTDEDAINGLFRRRRLRRQTVLVLSCCSIPVIVF